MTWYLALLLFASIGASVGRWTGRRAAEKRRARQDWLPGGPSSSRYLPVVNHRGFTLVELLVVITIILIISIVALPTIIPALSHRQVSEGARILQANLAGARDAAIRDNAPSGIRLLPDPTFNGIGDPLLANGQPNPYAGRLDPSKPLAYNRMIPISKPPDYSEGRITTWPGPGLPPAVAALAYPGPGTPANPTPTWNDTSVLMVYEASLDSNGILNSPTSWYWNIHVGDQIQINNAGPWYTVVGPMNIAGAAGNPDLFVNVGQPGTISPFVDPSGNPCEFLLLVNGKDGNGNAWIDEGWDGVDNDGKNGVDDIGEWIETERWLGSLGGG